MPDLTIRFFLSPLVAVLLGTAVTAQDTETTPQPPAPTDQAPATSAPRQLTEQEARDQYARSMNFMLRRSKLVRSLAAQHILYIGENASKPDLHLVEEATQVMAFDMVCGNGNFEAEKLDQLATESTYRIAVEAANSPIAKTLVELGQEQRIPERMVLLGDISTTVLMFQVARRRGLFDSLVTDFGKDSFCNGMLTNMRDRYDSLTDGGEAAEGSGE